MYDQSLNNADAFWTEKAKEFVTWHKDFSTVNTSDLASGKVEWFADGQLNVCENCVDRHLETRGDKVAILWEGDEPNDIRRITYKELHAEVCKFANVLKAQGVKKGDRVAIYMPMIPETAFAMLACARIGAVHSVVFAGFSADSLRDRILDSQCSVLLTADEGLRGTKRIPLKQIADKAVEESPVFKKLWSPAVPVRR